MIKYYIMKKIIRLTESDLNRIVRRTIKEMVGSEMGEDISYDIKSVNCEGRGNEGYVNVDRDGTIVIRYCEGDVENLEYLKRKGKKLLYSNYSLPSDNNY